MRLTLMPYMRIIDWKVKTVILKFKDGNNSQKIHSTCFWNNEVNIKVTPNGEIHQTLHTTDMEKLLGIKNLDDSINNTSF